MTNVMKQAWTIARKGATKFGGSPKEYFAQALKMAWAIAKKGTVAKITDGVKVVASKVKGLFSRKAKMNTQESTTQLVADQVINLDNMAGRFEFVEVSPNTYSVYENGYYVENVTVKVSEGIATVTQEQHDFTKRKDGSFKMTTNTNTFVSNSNLKLYGFLRSVSI